MSVDGMIKPACVTYEGGMGEDVFVEWARSKLLPNLRPGTTLVLDNASTHHTAAFTDLLTSAKEDPTLTCGLVRWFYLPAYSPDFNPIERCFAQIKKYVTDRHEHAITNMEDVI